MLYDEKRKEGATMSQDYCERKVKDRCPITGFPRDEHGHLLELVEDMAEGADKSIELTNPYGSLQYAIGSGNDFLCMDHAFISRNGKQWVVLHASRNSESGPGGYLEGAGYKIVPLGPKVQGVVFSMMDGAFEEVQHSVRGWNQDRWYWYRAVTVGCARVLGDAVPEFSQRQTRRGGKRIDAWIQGFWKAQGLK
jgi:hypothetical protein